MKKALLSLIFLAGCLFSQAQSSETLPNISLKDIDGNQVNIQDYSKSGKIVVFSFWATWCSPCKKELNNIKEYYPEWVDKYGIEIVAVSIDNARNTTKVKPFVNAQGWDYTVLLDVNEDFKRALNAPNVPYTVMIDKKGKIVYTHNGYVEGDELELLEKIKEHATL